MKHSKHLPGRNFDIHVARLIEKTTGGKIENIRRALAEKGLKPMQLFDSETARMAWLSSYKKNVKKLGHKQAVKLADDFTLRTQMSGKVGDVAPIQTSHGGRLMTLFQTFTIGEWNWLLKDVMGIKNPEANLGTNVVRGMRFIATTVAMNAFFEDVLNIHSPFPAPEKAVIKGIDEGQPVTEIAAGVIGELFEQLPVVGGAVKYSSDYRPMLPSAPLQTMGDIVATISRAKDLDINKMSIYDLELIAKVTGLPGAAQARKFLTRIQRGESIPGALLGVKKSEEKGIQW